MNCSGKAAKRLSFKHAALALAIVLGLALFQSAFEHRNCRLAHDSISLDDIFRPPEARFLGYSEKSVGTEFKKLPPESLEYYASSQLQLDVAFPIFYALTIGLLLGRKSRFLGFLPIVALCADVGENWLLASMARDLSTIGELHSYASVSTSAKWLMVVISIIALLYVYGAFSAFLKLLHRIWILRSELVRYLVLIRVPILCAGTIGLLPWFGRYPDYDHPALTGGLPLVMNMFTLNSRLEIVVATALALWISTIIIFSAMHIWRLAPIRFDLTPMGIDPRQKANWLVYTAPLTGGVLLSLPMLLNFRLERTEQAIPDSCQVLDLEKWACIVIGVVIAAFVVAIAKYVRDWQKRYLGLVLPGFRLLEKLVGRGYLTDDGTGVLRGHGIALGIAAVMFTLYVGGFFWLDPTTALKPISTISYLLLFVGILCLLLTKLTFIFDPLRLPLVLVVVAILYTWTLLPHDWFDAGHYFEVSVLQSSDNELDSKSPPDIELSIARRTEHRTTSSGPNIVVVAASGGGIQAAAWTGIVLTGLTEVIGKEFSDAIYFISGTSGGAVGIYFYLEALRELEIGNEHPMKSVAAAARASSLEATAWGLVFPDLLRSVFPVVFRPWNAPMGVLPHVRKDRAWALEQAWQRWRACMLISAPGQFLSNSKCNRPLRELVDIQPRLSDWWHDAREGSLPGVVFNATVLESGQQFYASNLNLDAFSSAIRSSPTFGDDWTFSQFDPAHRARYPQYAMRCRVSDAPKFTGIDGPSEGSELENSALSEGRVEQCSGGFMDMPVVTAARLSATFPYVTPAAMAISNRQNEEFTPWHLGDGGYFDNTGTVAALRWIHQARTFLSAVKLRKLTNANVLWLQISPFPGDAAEPPDRDDAWTNSAMGPIRGITNVRTSSQLERADLELTILNGTSSEKLAEDTDRSPVLPTQAIDFRPPSSTRNGLNHRDIPLSWELSRADVEQLQCDWYAQASLVDDIRCDYFGAGRHQWFCECYKNSTDIKGPLQRRKHCNEVSRCMCSPDGNCDDGGVYEESDDEVRTRSLERFNRCQEKSTAKYEPETLSRDVCKYR